jgi:hypothetical protein
MKLSEFCQLIVFIRMARSAAIARTKLNFTKTPLRSYITILFALAFFLPAPLARAEDDAARFYGT